VANGPKPEFSPLLAEGFYAMTLPELRALCVAGFPLSIRRDPIMLALEAMCTAISVTLIKGEVWVDGSFLTKKIEPDDVDVVVAIKHGIFNTPQQQDVLLRVANKQFAFPLPCDSYVHIDYPEGHPKHQFSQWMRAYWRRMSPLQNRPRKMRAMCGLG
jgi:hypothetical protein